MGSASMCKRQTSLCLPLACAGGCATEEGMDRTAVLAAGDFQGYCCEVQRYCKRLLQSQNDGTDNSLSCYCRRKCS